MIMARGSARCHLLAALQLEARFTGRPACFSFLVNNPDNISVQSIELEESRLRLSNYVRYALNYTEPVCIARRVQIW